MAATVDPVTSSAEVHGPAVSLEDQLACVEREIGFRERTYPRHVKLGKLTQAAADLELARMRAVRETLVGLPVALQLVREAERQTCMAIFWRFVPSGLAVRMKPRLQQAFAEADAGRAS